MHGREGGLARVTLRPVHVDGDQRLDRVDGQRPAAGQRHRSLQRGGDLLLHPLALEQRVLAAIAHDMGQQFRPVRLAPAGHARVAGKIGAEDAGVRRQMRQQLLQRPRRPIDHDGRLRRRRPRLDGAPARSQRRQLRLDIRGIKTGGRGAKHDAFLRRQVQRLGGIQRSPAQPGPFRLAGDGARDGHAGQARRQHQMVAVQGDVGGQHRPLAGTFVLYLLQQMRFALCQQPGDRRAGGHLRLQQPGRARRQESRLRCANIDEGGVQPVRDLDNAAQQNPADAAFMAGGLDDQVDEGAVTAQRDAGQAGADLQQQRVDVF